MIAYIVIHYCVAGALLEVSGKTADFMIKLDKTLKIEQNNT